MKGILEMIYNRYRKVDICRSFLVLEKAWEIRFLMIVAGTQWDIIGEVVIHTVTCTTS